MSDTKDGADNHLYKSALRIIENEKSFSLNPRPFPVLFIGDFSVGKTSLIRRYTEGFFSQNYKLTIGVDFAVKVRGRPSFIDPF
jgi:GTPase SAR1 family protein